VVESCVNEVGYAVSRADAHAVAVEKSARHESAM
jgi:hypothetical protein